MIPLLPFGDSVHFWRLKRSLSQEQLAQLAHVPRPNLSAIERNKREVSLKTIRALALALDIRPGVLVDGVLPDDSKETTRLSRETMERIARSVVEKRRLPNKLENDMAQQLGSLLQSKLDAARGETRRGRMSPVPDRARLFFSSYSPQILHSLIERCMNRVESSGSKTD